MDFLFLGSIGGWEILIMLFLVPALMVVAIVDLLRRRFDDSANKVIWALIVLFLPVLGALAYFIFGRKNATGNVNK